MATSATSFSDVLVKEQGVNFALQVIRREKGCPGSAPTGFGKSLVYQLMAPFADFEETGFRSTETVDRIGCILIMFMIICNGNDDNNNNYRFCSYYNYKKNTRAVVCPTPRSMVFIF